MKYICFSSFNAQNIKHIYALWVCVCVCAYLSDGLKLEERLHHVYVSLNLVVDRSHSILCTQNKICILYWPLTKTVHEISLGCVCACVIKHDYTIGMFEWLKRQMQLWGDGENFS